MELRQHIPLLSVTGEVVFESVHHNVHKKSFEEFAHKTIARRLHELPEAVEWANYFVIVSPGLDHEEVRCQIDVETDSGFAGFGIGFGFRPNHAFNDAIERLQWYEKNQPLRQSS